MQVVRPKRLLYIAIDGVAPRAKMNNQRERRYKFVDEVRLFKQKASEEGQEVCQDYFDPNSISPGTSFMMKMNEELQRFVERKMESDTLWQGVEVRFSGVDVPGEGEHKMMQYIREHQSEPNVRHCMYGLDADLIILALATHQPYITILREEINITYIREEPRRKVVGEPLKFQMIVISLLREYLRLDFACLPDIDFERLVDDFVLMVAFVGNDFIPRLPTFEISEGSINFLITSYKKLWSPTNYLTHNGVVLWENLAVFLKDLPQYERKALQERIKSKKRRRENEPMPADKKFLSLKKIYLQGVNSAYQRSRAPRRSEAEEESDEEVPVAEDVNDSETAENARKRLKGDLKQGGMELIKMKYYQECFGVGDVRGEEGGRKIMEVTREYLRGLQWVLFYYYRGCPDWEWYYPYHYGPMISDFTDVGTLMGIPSGSEVPFSQHQPYRPLEQLVSVLPPDSSKLLPIEIQPILTSGQYSSYFPIKPTIEYDFLCAKIGWQSLKIILPFVDLELVRKIMGSTAETEEIRVKNMQNTDISYTYRGGVRREVLPESKICGFTANLIPGTMEKHPDFPELGRKGVRGKMKELGVNIFLSRSMLETMVLEVETEQEPLEKYTGLVGQVRYVHYPNYLPALVVAVSSPEATYPPDFHFDNILTQAPQELREQLDFHLKFIKGIKMKRGPRVLLHVQPLQYIAKHVDGSYSYVWAKALWYYPLELTTDVLPVGHHVGLPLPQVLKDEFRLGEEVVCGLKAAYGAKGTVVGYGFDNHCEQGSVTITNLLPPISLPHDLLSSLRHDLPFIQLRDISRDLQTSPRVLSRLLGNLKLKYSSNGSVGMYQLGLDLVKFKDWLHVEGWTRWNDRSNSYEYSREVVPLLQGYKQRFGGLWQRLEQLQSAKIARVEMLFPGVRNPLPELRRIAFFVSKLPTARLPWTPDGSMHCGAPQLQGLEQYMQTVQRTVTTQVYNANPALLISSLPPYIKPDHCERIRFEVGCAVVNLNSRDLPYVPFGAWGIVIGVFPNDCVEVLFEGHARKNTKIVRNWNLLNADFPFFVKLRTESAAGDTASRRMEPSRKPGHKPKNTAGRYSIQVEKTTSKPHEKEEFKQKKSAGMQHFRTVSEAVPRKKEEPPSFQLKPSAEEFVPTFAQLDSREKDT